MEFFFFLRTIGQNEIPRSADVSECTPRHTLYHNMEFLTASRNSLLSIGQPVRCLWGRSRTFSCCQSLSGRDTFFCHYALTSNPSRGNLEHTAKGKELLTDPLGDDVTSLRGAITKPWPRSSNCLILNSLEHASLGYPSLFWCVSVVNFTIVIRGQSCIHDRPKRMRRVIATQYSANLWQKEKKKEKERAEKKKQRYKRLPN